MPIFNDCTGFHIHDGNFHQVSGDANFYQVSGDVHLQTQQLMIGDHPAHPDVAREALAGPSGSIPSAAASQLQDGWTEGFRREPPGAARSLRRTMTAPYDASSRPRMRGSSDFEGYPGPAPSTSSALIPSSGFSSPYSQGESRHEWNRPSIPPSMPLPPINPSSNSRSQSHYPLDYQYFYPGPLPGPRPDYDRQEGGSQLPGVEASPNRPDYRPSDLAPRFDRVQPGAEPSIHGGTFITAQNVNNDYRHGETGINILHRGVALEALHDSADSFPQPRCHPETRKQMLDDLWGFATDAEHRDRVLWLHGPAGAGKSAIMWSLCERLQDVGRLGAAFFFKRGHPTRGNARALFSTIAYRLALRIPWLKGPISQAVESDPSLVSSTPRIQFQQLVLGPCRARTDQAPAIIIIDGLDECDGRQMQQEILRILSSHQHHNSVRILVASRPEAHISEITSNAAAYQAFNVEQSFKDVRRYLVDEFARIRQAHARTMRNVPTPWPSHEELETLVDKSSGHFIYASTVIKFVDDPNFRPTKRLGIIVGNLTDSEYDTPFSTLDELYTQILSTAPKNTQLVNILCAIVYFPGHFSPCDIDRLLELEAGDTDLALRSLHSLVKLEWRQVRWHHASFEDFLCDASRAGKFYVGELASRMDLARSVLNALSSLDLAHDAAWSVGWDWIRYVVESVPPSAALLPLIRSINPVFFGAGLGSEEEDKIIGWFQAIHPVPDDLIQLWEDYIFMGDLSFRWGVVDSMPSSNRAALPIQECREAVSKSPGLQRILYATQFLSTNGTFCFFKVVLDSMPWDDIRSLICPLRDVIGDTPRADVRKLWSSIIFTERAKHLQWATEDKAMAHRCLQVLKDVGSGQLSLLFWYLTHPFWGLLIRIIPPCLVLLQEIREFELPFWFCDGSSIEIHNVVQWLKTFPEPPLDVIQLWEGYFLKVYRLTREKKSVLKEDMERQNREYSFNDSFDSVPHLMWLSEGEGGLTKEVPT